MGVSSKHGGWRLDKANSRLDFYYAGTRIGHIDAGGIDLAAGLAFQVNNVGVTASTLDSAYDGGNSITVDGSAVTLAGSHATNAVLAITNATGSGAGITIAQSGTGSDITGTATWSVSKTGAAVFGTIAGTTLTLSSDIDISASATGTYDLILKDAVADALSIRRSTTDVIVFDTATPAVTITPATTITGALTASAGVTCTTGGLTVSAGGATITGNSTITGTLAVSGAINWGATFTVDELILDSDGVAPDSTYCYAVSDNTGDVTVNALSGKEVHIAIAGNDEYDLNATAFQVKSGNNIQFEGDNGILDSAANEVIMVKAVGSAVNYLQVENAATANNIVLECQGTADKGFTFMNDQDEELLVLSATASAVAEVAIAPAATTNYPTISGQGETNTGIAFVAAGTGSFTFNNGTDPVILKLLGAQAGWNNEIHDVNNNELLDLYPVASAIYEFGIMNAASSDVPTLQSVGAADIGMAFETSESEEMLVLAATSTATTFVTITSQATTVNPSITGSGETNTGLDLIASGTGAIRLNNGTDPVILTFLGAQAGYNNEIQDVNGAEIIALQGVASAVCEIGITNAATGNPATIKAQGETDSNLMLDTTGTGKITLALGGDEVLRLHDAASMTFAAAADTNGHAGYLQTEDGGVDTAVDGGSVGGLFEIRTGDGSAGGAAQAGGAGGALTLITGAGGVPASGSANGGVGGTLAITGGAGGAAGAGGGVGGNGGIVTLTAGAAGGAGGGTAGKAGLVYARSPFAEITTQTAKTDTVTLTAAELLTKVIDGDPTGAATYTLPTAALLVAQMPGAAVGDSFYFIVNNKDAALTITVGAGAGGTGDGTLTVAPNVIRGFFVILTNVGGGTETYSLYGLSA